MGEQPTFAKQIAFATSDSCCNCIFKSCPIQTKLNHENQGCKFRQGNGAIAARWQAKAGVEPPFAGRWKLFFLGARIFCKVIFRCNCSPGTVARDCLLLRFHKAERSCSPRLEKLSLFSPPPPCAKSMAQGFRCLRAAIRATRPEPRQHFWKIVGSKNFYLPAARFLQPIS